MPPQPSLVMHAPGDQHWQAADYIMRYLSRNPISTIRYRRTGKPLAMYVDASYLPDYGTNFDNRRSTSGHCAILAGACTVHRSYRQDTLATSTTESEYIAAFEATREVRRQRIQLAFLGLPQLLPTPLYEDNESAIRIATAGNGDSSSKRRQHIDGKYHWLRRAITDGIIDMVYCETAHQAADSFTKPLARDLVKRFHDHQAGRQRMPIPQHNAPGRIGLSLTRPDLFPHASSV